jgi:uncharacterized membrane protein YdcZ (DUF606 family)
MNALVIILAVFVGIATVLQAALNRRIAANWGLGPTIVLHAGVLFAFAIASYFAIEKVGLAVPASFRAKAGAYHNPLWWYLIPGLAGWVIIFAMPFAISKIGALQVFVWVVAAQVLAGLCWDRWVEGIAINAARAIGVAVVILGAALTTLRPPS